MRDLVLREATDANVPALVTVVHSAFEEYRGKLDPPSGAHDETVETVRQKMTSARVVLALLADETIGCVFYERAEGHLSFSRLAVQPAYRRRGIGQALVAYVEDRARALNVGRVRLGVRVALAPLRAYYQRRGYHLVEYRTHDGYAEPTYVILEKDLNSVNDPGPEALGPRGLAPR